MSITLRLNLRGDSIPMSEFIDALADMRAILAELDSDISGQKTMDWDVCDLRAGSAVVEAAPRLLGGDRPDNRAAVTGTFVRGLEALERGAERPAHFSDRALQKAKHLTGLIGEHVQRICFNGNIEEERLEDVAITQHVAANVDDIIGLRLTSIGSVEGTLETLSMHGASFFNVYETLSGRKVKCTCDPDMLKELSPSFGKRVLVSGIIGENAKGQAVSMKVKEYRVLRDRSELPQVEDIRGLYATDTNAS